MEIDLCHHFVSKYRTRLELFGFSVRNIQRRLDNFASWYNEYRPHSSLGTRTPEEAFRGNILPKPIPIRARDGPNIQIDINRGKYCGDPPVFKTATVCTAKSVASVAKTFGGVAINLVSGGFAKAVDRIGKEKMVKIRKLRNFIFFSFFKRHLIISKHPHQAIARP